MNVLDKLRLKAASLILDRHTSSVRRIQYRFDMEKVEKIGILWDATHESDFQHLASLNRQLNEMNKRVEVLAWIPGKSVPDRLTGLSYMRFLRKKDLNFIFIPTSEDARQFMATKFDLLIDINPSSRFPLIYITALSPALMKVGPDVTDRPEKMPYDLMIRTQKPFSTSAFLEQVMHYLAMISNPDTRA